MTNSKGRSGPDHFAVRTIEPSPEGVRIFRIAGIFGSGTREYEFLEDVRADLADDIKTVILDLSEVTHLTSGGIGVVAAVFTAARDAERSMMLAGSSSRSVAAMKVSGLLPIIPTFDSVDAALQAATR
ncbi:MAG: STAS domain-containing protein [Gemmatimonadetes bacterium]|nr:STAS domain-containing protein [Gemmatimonadota bacterium]